MNFKKKAALLITLTLFTGCQQGETGNLFTKENMGTAAGAVGGAWLGSNVGKGKGQIVGIAAGTLLGAALGKSLGASLDKADVAQYNNTAQTALETAPSGRASSWRNPDSGNSGTITPVRTYSAPTGEYCREYTQTINVGGKTQQGHGTACRQPDGSWQIKQ
ncbi:MAG: 17 kD surface antigen [Rickettsiaceae bacterium]|jgi:surface antigen|nr:17 kD surface antigen [Rickettsiaceae bacterium]